MDKKNMYIKIAGAVLVALIISCYFFFNQKQETKTDLSQDNFTQSSSGTEDTNSTSQQTESTQTVADQNENNVSSKETGSTDQTIAAEKNPEAEILQTSKPDNLGLNSSPDSKNDVRQTTELENVAIKILKSEVTSNAKFYQYAINGTTMEVIAVKASDGTIRTVLNTCQVCYKSGKGYFSQDGEYLVCKNCGNRFHLDQVGNVKGGCNPIPILQENKQDTGEYISITKDYMASQKNYFSNWNKY